MPLHGEGQPFQVLLIRCRKTRHKPHQPHIGSEMPVGMVAEVPLTGLSFGPAVGWQSLCGSRYFGPLAAIGAGDAVATPCTTDLNGRAGSACRPCMALADWHIELLRPLSRQHKLVAFWVYAHRQMRRLAIFRLWFPAE